MPLIQRYLGGVGSYNGVRCIREEWTMPPEGYGRRVQFWVPSTGRKDEQGYLRAREALCRNVAFREEIQTLRKLYLETFSKYDRVQSNRLSIDAERVCERWGFQGMEWVVWLTGNWDPAQTDLPPREPIEIMPALGNWVLKVEIVRQPGFEESPRQAVLTFTSGISFREAQRAATVAFKTLRSSTRAKGARPGLTELDKEMLQTIFRELGVAPPRAREKTIRKAEEIMKDDGRPLSHSKVASEYRRWLAEQGQPIKRYDRM